MKLFHVIVWSLVKIALSFCSFRLKYLQIIKKNVHNSWVEDLLSVYALVIVIG